ncbi:MAG: zinc ribbon domain-containing protein, partial [Chloroflexia bacterium]|nr:zinc ribbon domain-containing protein [Chloroflexia bacterium]
MYCRECGATTGASDVTCRSCGRVLSPEPADVPCVQCQRGIGADAIFCPHCGVARESAGQAPMGGDRSPGVAGAPPAGPAGDAPHGDIPADLKGTSLLSQNGTARIGGDGASPRPWAPAGTPTTGASSRPANAVGTTSRPGPLTPPSPA